MRAAAAASASGLPGRAIQTPGRLACYRVRSKRVVCPIALLLLQFRHLSEADNGVAGIGDGGANLLSVSVSSHGRPFEEGRTTGMRTFLRSEFGL